MPNFRAIKISRGTTQPGYAGATSNIQIVSNTSKTPYLNQATPKNICQNFPTQKIPEIENFKPKQILLPPLSVLSQFVIIIALSNTCRDL